MASKTSMLKQGAKTTGKGLFAGMSRLDTREEARLEDNEITVDINNGEEKTDSVNEIGNELTDQTSEKTAHEEIKNEVHNEPETIPEESVIKHETEVINEPEIEKVTEQIVEPVIEKKEEHVETAPIQEKVADITPVMTKIAEQAQDINSKNNISEKAETNNAKSSSRYEKEKFLLLDIRGYRDYVEHMAKAANMSATKYIRNLIQQDMDKNNDIYLAHKALEEKLRGRSGN